MKHFLRENRLISVIFGLSIIVIILYILDMDASERFLYAEDLFNVLFQLAIGFVINFIFYVTQVYVPRIKQMEQANNCIYKRLERIEKYMRELFEYLAQIYISDYDSGQELARDQLKVIMQNLDFENEVNVVNVNRANMSNYNFTVKEWMKSRMEFIEHDIDKIYLYYAAYISPELMNVLENILKSAMHQNMGRILLQLPQGIPIKDRKYEQDIFFEPYYKLMIELGKVKQQFK